MTVVWRQPGAEGALDRIAEALERIADAAEASTPKRSVETVLANLPRIARVAQGIVGKRRAEDVRKRVIHARKARAGRTPAKGRKPVA